MRVSSIYVCRVCQSEVKEILDLGAQNVITFEDNKEDKVPLQLVICTNKECNLVQLRHTVDPERLYRQFWYKSGVNKTMLDELENIVVKATSYVPLKRGDVVIDIGANDGSLLMNYPRNVYSFGVEPAMNLATDLHKSCDVTITEFFNADNHYFDIGGKSVQAKIITAIAMFYDLEDPNKFLQDVKKVLHKDGIFVIQMNYLPTMLKNNAFDNILHEHLEYYSLHSLQYVLEKNGLHAFHADEREINGGSIRVFISHKETTNPFYRETDDFDNLWSDENVMKLDTLKPYEDFIKRIDMTKTQVLGFLKNLKNGNGTIMGYGASTRGNSLLQYFGLTKDDIPLIADRNPDKWGKKTTGTNIPIISEEEMRRQNPDYLFMLPYYFEKEFREREKGYLNKGFFVIPLPHFRIVGKV
jgi:NDP-4-keto-2,6-dideoxyhexose 3-C-methyltransferase